MSRLRRFFIDPSKSDEEILELINGIGADDVAIDEGAPDTTNERPATSGEETTGPS